MTQDFSIFLDLRPTLVRVAYTFFRNWEDAEDVVQDVLLKLLQRGFKEGDNIEALAVKAVKNACVSIWRKRRGRRLEGLGTMHIDISAIERSDAMLEAKDTQVSLMKAISSLPRSERRLILLWQSGIESEDIALITGIPVRSVRTMLSSARRNLLDKMGKEL